MASRRFITSTRLLTFAAALAASALWPALGGHAGEQLAFLRASVKPAVEAEEPAAAPHTGGQGLEEHLARRAVERESFYDPANPDLRKLQRMEEVTRGMPFDANGFPDWMRALREGLIKPRTGLTGKEKMEVLDLDIIMRNTKEMPNVRFPHRPHTLWLDCSNCHPEPFKPMAGSNNIRMADIFRGNFCGKCHDRVAFITFFSCSRCHSVPQGAAGLSAKPQ